jgi:hypothetical protein
MNVPEGLQRFKGNQNIGGSGHDDRREDLSADADKGNDTAPLGAVDLFV